MKVNKAFLFLGLLVFLGIYLWQRFVLRARIINIQDKNVLVITTKDENGAAGALLPGHGYFVIVGPSENRGSLFHELGHIALGHVDTHWWLTHPGYRNEDEEKAADDYAIEHGYGEDLLSHLADLVNEARLDGKYDRAERGQVRIDRLREILYG